ncbi:GNAT family N-acetyltransferase [Candidatus Acetothermia bacterium]|nr:GNAT family N-acetyltransferase [Candidatus Acetothermia bacterium]MBI3642749.1 GNAT family N-acetyltransferase [Candidatus Acetothermia bacterium]
MPSIIIRDLRIEDYDALIALWQESKLPFKPEGRDRKEKIGKEIQKSNAIYLVAQLDSKIIGSVFGTHDGRKGWINRVAVAPAYRRQGIAHRLIREAESRITNLGIEVIACLIEDGNLSSIEVFKSLGYSQNSPHLLYFSKKKHKEA